MDVVQGGTFETAKIIATEFSPEFYAAGLAQEWRTFKPNHSFIPTISSLAFKNPNFDWSTPLNRNLICDPANKEIPFDNYFSPSSNEEHVALTQESVDWLLNEFKGIDQTPRFSLNNVTITGPSVICENTNTTFSFPDICKIPSAVAWSINANAQIVSSTGYSVVIKGLTNGSATLTATFQNGQTLTKKIWSGGPDVRATVSLYPEMEIKNKVCFYSNIDGVSLAQQGVIRNLTPGLNGNYCYTGFLAEDENYFSIANSCGTTTYTLQDLIGSARPDNLNLNSKFYKTYPNPTNNIINIELKNIEDKPNDNSIIFAELYNMMGEVKRNVTVNNNIATIEVLGLPTGIYVLKINIDGIIESHQIAIE